MLKVDRSISDPRTLRGGPARREEKREQGFLINTSPKKGPKKTAQGANHQGSENLGKLERTEKQTDASARYPGPRGM